MSFFNFSARSDDINFKNITDAKFQEIVQKNFIEAAKKDNVNSFNN